MFQNRSITGSVRDTRELFGSERRNVYRLGENGTFTTMLSPNAIVIQF